MAATLHPKLLAPWELCESTRRRLLASIGSIPAASWKERPREGTWSPAEHADHLHLSEVGTSKMVRKLIRGDFASLSRPQTATLYDSRLDAYPYSPLPAPDVLSPFGRDPGEVVALLDASHRRLAEELSRYDGEDPDEIGAPDPATAVWFTLAGWVLLQALHEGHHIDRMETGVTSSS
jgi:hypothetical protein